MRDHLSQLYLEDNNGGDCIHITPLSDNRIHLKVGHCCVYEIDHIVPVAWLTSVLVEAVLDAGGVPEALQQISWPDEYKHELLNRIVTTELWKVIQSD